MTRPPIRVVVADDTEDIRRLLRVALHLEGDFDVIGEAADGDEAVALVAAERPDVVVLDLAMPVMDGLQAIPRIREISPLTRIVVLSGFNAGQMASEARALGADAYLEKGTAFDDLAALLRHLHDGGVLADTPVASEPGPAPTTVPQPPLDAPASFAAALAGAPDLAAAFDVFAARAAEIAPFDRASFAVATEQPGRFKVLAAAGSAAWRLPVGALVPIEGDSADRLGRGQPWVELDTATRDDVAVVRELRQRGLRSFVSVPIVVAGGLRAVVSFASLQPGVPGVAAAPALAGAVDEVAAVLHVLALLDVERQVSRRLRDLDRLRNDFVAMVAHDLRSPMTSIAGFAQCLERGWNELDDEMKLDFVASISRNIRGLSALVEDVFTVAHIQSGEFQLDIGPLDLGDVLRRTVAEVGNTVPHRRIVIDVPDRLPAVHGDALRQRQVIANLLANALKFSPADRPVRVTARQVAGAIEVSVEDGGIGIARQHLARLFDRFYRTPEGRSHDRTGTGLGLYICRSLVESWGGTIRVESELGRGSTFTYSSPLTGDGPAPTDPEVGRSRASVDVDLR